MFDVLPHVIPVRAEWDADAAVWTAQSADIPGLVAEADTLEALQAKLLGMISDLIELSGMRPICRTFPSASSRIPSPAWRCRGRDRFRAAA